MSVRKALLRTTMLVGVVGATYLSGRDAQAQPIFAPNFAAVDGINGKVEALGGSAANRSLYGSRAAVSFPLAQSWGLQIDGAGGGWDGKGFGSIGGHLFWRNPAQGLAGLYVNHLHWNGFGGLNVTQVGAEGEYYWQRWTLQGVVGIEFGNSSSQTATTPPVVSGGPYPPGITTTTTADVKTRFFDQINLKYYVTDNAAGYVGHRYLGGRHAFALGGEAAMPFGGGRMASAFVEGRVGESNTQGVWGGLKMYFGQKDKPLIARHREDDPAYWSIGSLVAIAAALRGARQSTTRFCGPGDAINASGLC
jgi:hypothetical protein